MLQSYGRLMRLKQYEMPKNGLSDMPWRKIKTKLKKHEKYKQTKKVRN
jgi:hypothetical protein